MKHKIGFNRLGRKASHRKAMSRNMVTSLFQHERITTTKAKALEIRRLAEKMITRAKVDSVHNRRMIGRDIKDKEILAKLFTTIGPRYTERPGGYTRILKIGQRQGDAAEMVLLELVEDQEEKSTSKKKKTAAKSSKPKTAKKAESNEASVKSEADSVEKEAKEDKKKPASKKASSGKSASSKKETTEKKTSVTKAESSTSEKAAEKEADKAEKNEESQAEKTPEKESE